MVVTKLGFEFYNQLRMFLTAYIVGMVASDVNKITRICLPITGNSLDSIIVAATDNCLHYSHIKV